MRSGGSAQPFGEMETIPPESGSAHEFTLFWLVADPDVTVAEAETETEAEASASEVEFRKDLIGTGDAVTVSNKTETIETVEAERYCGINKDDNPMLGKI